MLLTSGHDERDWTANDERTSDVTIVFRLRAVGKITDTETDISRLTIENQRVQMKDTIN